MAPSQTFSWISTSLVALPTWSFLTSGDDSPISFFIFLFHSLFDPSFLFLFAFFLQPEVLHPSPSSSSLSLLSFFNRAFFSPRFFAITGFFFQNARATPYDCRLVLCIGGVLIFTSPALLWSHIWAHPFLLPFRTCFLLLCLHGLRCFISAFICRSPISSSS